MKIRTILIGLSLFFLLQEAEAQKQGKFEKLISEHPTWAAVKVKSKRPYFEVGETMTFRVDKNFYHDRNNYGKKGGTWILNGKDLILNYDSFTEERSKVPYEYKVKVYKDGFRLKYRNRFNKNEKVYFRKG